jgi:hypothetical protein
MAMELSGGIITAMRTSALELLKGLEAAPTKLVYESGRELRTGVS